MSDTSMIRIDNKLKTKLKEYAKSEGRTLEYIVNRMATDYVTELKDGINELNVKPPIVGVPDGYRVYNIRTNEITEPTYTTIEETA